MVLMCRPDFSLLPIRGAFQQLTVWLEPQMPAKLLHDYLNSAVYVLRLVMVVPPMIGASLHMRKTDLLSVGRRQCAKRTPATAIEITDSV